MSRIQEIKVLSIQNLNKPGSGISLRCCLESFNGSVLQDILFTIYPTLQASLWVHWKFQNPHFAIAHFELRIHLGNRSAMGIKEYLASKNY